jgi:tripartite-type tricarboxylate transporter receptor subunit TctC
LLARSSATPAPMTAEAFGKEIVKEVDEIAAIIKAANIKIE